MKAIVLLSGGVDSTVALADTLAHGHDVLEAVTFDYRQTHARELGAANKIAAHYGIRQRVVELPVFSGSALTGDRAIPRTHAEAVNATYVPARNTVFLSVAAAIAESQGAGMVVYGANFDDTLGYPDCRPQFIAAMNDLLERAMHKPVWVHSPFVRMTKAQILELGTELDAPLNLAWSCYRGGQTPCGQCGACV